MIGSFLRKAQLAGFAAGGGPPSPSWTLDFTGTPSGYTLTRASTGTYVDSSGYIASASTDIARLTHNSSGSRLGLLVEEQRTNLVQRSGEFENGWWDNQAQTTCAGVTTPTAPDNSTDAAELKETTANNNHHRGQLGTTVSSGSVTFSAFVKKQSRRYVGLYVITFGGGNSYRAIFDLDNSAAFSAGNASGTPNASTGSKDYGNGWFRIWITLTTGVTNALPGVFLSDRSDFSGTLSSGLPSYTGSTSESVYVWGLQMENAATPSSYIPTVASSVTRSADIAYLGAVTNFGRPGSFVVEYYKPTEPNGHVLVAQDDVGSGGRLGLAYSSGGPRIIFGTTSAGSGGTDTAGLNKVGWAWDGSGAATRSAINGAAWDTSLATSFDPSTVTSIGLGGNVSDPGTLPITVSEQPNVIVRKITFYNSQLSAADLNTLTT